MPINAMFARLFAKVTRSSLWSLVEIIMNHPSSSITVVIIHQTPNHQIIWGVSPGFPHLDHHRPPFNYVSKHYYITIIHHCSPFTSIYKPSLGRVTKTDQIWPKLKTSQNHEARNLDQQDPSGYAALFTASRISDSFCVVPQPSSPTRLVFQDDRTWQNHARPHVLVCVNISIYEHSKNNEKIGQEYAGIQGLATIIGSLVTRETLVMGGYGWLHHWFLMVFGTARDPGICSSSGKIGQQHQPDIHG